MWLDEDMPNARFVLGVEQARLRATSWLKRIVDDPDLVDSEVKFSVHRLEKFEEKVVVDSFIHPLFRSCEETVGMLLDFALEDLNQIESPAAAIYSLQAVGKLERLTFRLTFRLSQSMSPMSDSPVVAASLEDHGDAVTILGGDRARSNVAAWAKELLADPEIESSVSVRLIRFPKEPEEIRSFNLGFEKSPEDFAYEVVDAALDETLGFAGAVRFRVEVETVAVRPAWSTEFTLTVNEPEHHLLEEDLDAESDGEVTVGVTRSGLFVLGCEGNERQLIVTEEDAVWMAEEILRRAKSSH